MDANEYKEYHEQYMKYNSGTSSEECAVLLLSLPFGVFFSLTMASYFNRNALPAFEFCAIVLPTILNVTIFSDFNHIVVLNMVLLFTAIVVTNVNGDSINKLLCCRVEERKNFVTYYRAGTNLFSALCILAVDFTLFPKRFAKTESFGFGFMDLGVGFFAFSNGLVQKHTATKNQFFKVMKSIFILFVLGVIRLLSVKSLNYHENVTEYGVHWNFFFTLGTCHLFAYIILLLMNFPNPLWLTLVTGLCHEIFLTLGLKEWVLSNIQRDSFLSANREGLTSCLGFICLYFAGSSAGKFFTLSSNLTFKKFFVKLLKLCLLTWLTTIICFKTIGISRRLANLGYILWIVTLSLTIMVLFLIVELSVIIVQKESTVNCNDTMMPCILESINANGLFFFLFSNLLTGLVNILFHTLLLGKMISMIIIITYMVILNGVTYILYIKKIFLKF